MNLLIITFNTTGVRSVVLVKLKNGMGFFQVVISRFMKRTEKIGRVFISRQKISRIKKLDNLFQQNLFIKYAFSEMQ